jgi:hypothetical protein
MQMAKRMIFTFDDASLKNLERIKARRKLSSTAEAVRQSIQIGESLQQQADQGYSEVIVRDPKTKKERVMVFSSSPHGSE